ncbi:MAG: RNA ligase family protein [Desulfobacterales bacterium]|nr:RNA ligase family protein [Desulfobacterales bacterium]
MSYMKIPNLYRVRDLFSNFAKLYAAEKVHGTSAHIRYQNDGPELGDHLSYFSGGADHAAFARLFDHEALLAKFRELDVPDVTVYGEAYGGKLQGMRDTYGPDLWLMAFEVKVVDSWLNMLKAFGLVDSLGLEFVPFKTIDGTPEAIEAAMMEPSVVAIRRGFTETKLREGVVLRPLEEFTLNNGGRVIAKHKHPSFAETAHPRSLTDPDVDLPEQKLAQDYCTAMRVAHVLDKFTAPRAPESIKPFIDAYYADVTAECTDAEREQLKGRKAISILSASLPKSTRKS